MTIISLTYQPYERVLRQPWRTAHGVWSVRRGWTIAVCDETGRTGWGEAAPLPEIGTESFSDCEVGLNHMQSALSGQEGDTVLKTLPTLLPSCPAVRCAIETALVDLLGYQLNVQAASQVRLNVSAGTLCDLSSDRLSTLHSQGYQVIKLKVGVQSVEDEIKALETLHKKLPDGVCLRLDANGAWDFEQAERFLGGITGLAVESLEEPLAHPNEQAWIELQNQVPFVLAQDESLQNGFLSATRRVVLKPMALGGPLSSYRLGQALQEQGIETIVTTSIDGPIATHAALVTAAALDPAGRWAHGLGTAELFEDQSGFDPVKAVMRA